jgi:ribonuclease BN (tRNA processing enzyme)
MGEALALDGRMLSVRLRGRCTGADSLLVRDAVRRADGSLGTAETRYGAAAPQPGPVKTQPGEVETQPDEVEPPWQTPYGGEVSAQPSEVPRPRVRTGSYTAALLNGVFGDPLLLVRLLHASRSVLFDLGEAVRLPARVAHQVTDVLLSHAHADHIAGFLSFLRARIGDFPPCRIFGPPGMAENIAGLVSGFHWDRAGERGPRFEVAELHAGHRLVRFEVTIHAPRPVHVGEAAASEGILQADALFAVRAALLDHRTPVLAYALEPPLDVKVRKERLEALGLRPGPWLTQLKLKVLEGRDEDRIELPGSEPRTVRSLTDDLLVVRPGPKLVYATDFADTADNRKRLTALAQGANVFFCESTFCAEHRAQAERTGHLTAQACGEIAAAAGVERLAPFHFSKRYEGHAPKVYAEIAAAYGGSIVGWSAPSTAGRHTVRQL